MSSTVRGFRAKTLSFTKKKSIGVKSGQRGGQPMAPQWRPPIHLLGNFKLINAGTLSSN
jgi:hypothetical protein